jgi:hypothetical protein
MKLNKTRRQRVMLGMAACLLLALGATTGISTAADGVLHAKPSVTGLGDCLSWDNACTLQTALGIAGTGDEIWVAAGTHKPTDGIDRTATFQLKNGVALYGGFAGTETSREDRDWTLHETILSGDIGTVGDDSDNSYHVVTGSGTDATAILDGFTITGGKAEGAWYEPSSRGAGMYNDIGSPTLTNVTFTSNSAQFDGGGMYNNGGSPTLTNVSFNANSANDDGGGMVNWDGSNASLTNVIFSGNSANDSGGAMYNVYSSPTLLNVTFSDNSASSWGKGGGMNNYDSSPTLTSVTFTGNFALLGGGMYNDESNPALSNVTFGDNSADGDGGGMYNSWYSSPTLANVIFSGNSAWFAGGGMHNDCDSNPALTNVAFTANSAGWGGGGMCNTGGIQTLTNVTFTGNSAYYGGGMLNNGGSHTVTNVSFSSNSATYGGGMHNWAGSSVTLTNVILWSNSAPNGAQISNDSSTPTISFSLVESSGGSGAGWDASLGTDGGGNIDGDPQFVDAPNEDLHLQGTSPAIGAGDNGALPADTLDLDGDGDTAELLPIDLDGNPRIVNGIVDMGAYETQVVPQEVLIDIKTGSYPNSINLSSEGVVPVAVLTTEDFDASTVDPVTVDFTGAAPLRWAWEDVDGDGDVDILFHFNTQELNLDENSTEATLNGMTHDGLVIWGVDTVNIIP